MIPFQQLVAAAHVQSVGSYGVGGGVLEGKYLNSLSPSGSTIFDERSGLGTARAVQPFRSYLFDGSNDHIVINGSASWVFPNMSFGAWVYRSDWSVSHSAGLITKGLNTQWGLFLEGPSLKVRIGTAGSDIISSVSSLTAGWHHLFATVEGTTSKIYIDGAEVASGTTNSMPTANANNVQIGRYLSVYPLSGQMSDTRLYSDTKTPAEVLAIKNQGFDISDMVDWWKCDDTHDTIAYGCFAGNNGTKTNITTGTGPGTFHAEGGTGWLPDSWQNDVGYSDSANGPVPRDESDTANDVLGDPLDYVGPVPRNVVAVNSNCVEFAGTGDYISAPHLGGTETVVSSGGTSTPTVSAGRIDFTAGTCWYLELSDGTLYPLSEGEGTDHYDPAGGNHAQAMNTGGGYHTTDSNARPSNLLDGYSLYEHATLDPIRVPYGSDGNPLSITPPTGYAKTSDHPAGAWHNGAETQFNFKPEPDASWVHQIEDASGESIPDQYSHGDVLPSFMTKVTANGNESQFVISKVE